MLKLKGETIICAVKSLILTSNACFRIHNNHCESSTCLHKFTLSYWVPNNPVLNAGYHDIYVLYKYKELSDTYD